MTTLTTAHPGRPPRTRPRQERRHAFIIGALLFGTLALGSASGAAAVGTRLGTADNFAILAGSTITNSGHSVVTGDVGLHPGSAVTGFDSCTGPANCVDLTGQLHVTDGVAQQAKADLLTAYNTLVGLEGTCTPLTVELGGRTLQPGVYCSPTFGLTGTLTLSGIGEYIFLTGAGGSELTTASGSQVLLTNGADACNVYWQVASSATIGTGSAFAGNILARTAISFDANATLAGSALARDAAVTLIANTITDSTCAGSDGGTSTGGTDATSTGTGGAGSTGGTDTATASTGGSTTAGTQGAGATSGSGATGTNTAGPTTGGTEGSVTGHAAGAIRDAGGSGSVRPATRGSDDLDRIGPDAARGASEIPATGFPIWLALLLGLLTLGLGTVLSLRGREQTSAAPH